MRRPQVLRRSRPELVALAKDDPHLQLVAAIDAATNPLQGKDAGEVAGVGTPAQIEDGVRGFQVALKQFGGKAGGRDIEVIVAPTDASPDSAIRAVRNLVIAGAPPA